METPYRENAILEELWKSLRPEIRLSMAGELMLTTECIRTEAAENWKKIKADLRRRPAVFSFLAS